MKLIKNIKFLIGGIISIMIGFAVLKRVLEMKQDYEVFIADSDGDVDDGERIKDKKNVKSIAEIKVDVPEITELTDRQIRILSLFNKTDKLFMDVIEKNIKGVHVRTLRREMEKLKEMELIDKKGSTRSSYYVKK